MAAKPFKRPRDEQRSVGDKPSNGKLSSSGAQASSTTVQAPIPAQAPNSFAPFLATVHRGGNTVTQGSVIDIQQQKHQKHQQQPEFCVQTPSAVGTVAVPLAAPSAFFPVAQQGSPWCWAVCWKPKEQQTLTTPIPSYALTGKPEHVSLLTTQTSFPFSPAFAPSMPETILASGYLNSQTGNSNSNLKAGDSTQAVYPVVGTTPAECAPVHSALVSDTSARSTLTVLSTHAESTARNGSCMPDVSSTWQMPAKPQPVATATPTAIPTAAFNAATPASASFASGTEVPSGPAPDQILLPSFRSSLPAVTSSMAVPGPPTSPPAARFRAEAFSATVEGVSSKPVASPIQSFAAKTEAVRCSNQPETVSEPSSPPHRTPSRLSPGAFKPFVRNTCTGASVNGGNLLTGGRCLNGGIVFAGGSAANGKVLFGGGFPIGGKDLYTQGLCLEPTSMTDVSCASPSSPSRYPNMSGSISSSEHSPRDGTMQAALSFHHASTGCILSPVRLAGASLCNPSSAIAGLSSPPASSSFPLNRHKTTYLCLSPAVASCRSPESSGGRGSEQETSLKSVQSDSVHTFAVATPEVSPSKRARRQLTETAKTCSNCGTASTPFWRKDKLAGGPLCNACGLYFSKNDSHRPRILWKSGSDNSTHQHPTNHEYGKVNG